MAEISKLPTCMDPCSYLAHQTIKYEKDMRNYTTLKNKEFSHRASGALT